MNLTKVTDGNVTEETIFDAYILEGAGGTYSFDLGLRYVDQVASEGYTADDNKIIDIANIEAGAMYIMGTNENKYVYANGETNVKYSTSFKDGEGEIDPNYVWRFDKVADDQYALASMGAWAFYMKSKDLSGYAQIPLTNTVDGNYFTVKNEGGHIVFETRSTGMWGSYYVNTYDEDQVCAISRYCYFYLYKVTKQGGSSSTVKAESTPTIPINIIDSKTGVASPLTSIKRNDFIEITVNASFNEQQGAIGFNTTNWQEGGGDVTFN